ncbi:DUF4190 domain-containing protein [Gordonia sp. NPDC003376]
MNAGRPAGPPVPPPDPEAGETRNLTAPAPGAPDAPTRSTTDTPPPPRPQAYSAVDVDKAAETVLTPVAPAATSSAPALSATPTSSPGDAARQAAAPDEEVSVGAQRAAARPQTRTTAPTNKLSVWAMVLSVLGCTSPIGLFLGYRARNQIRRTREYGSAFATVAIVVGWTYVVAILVALIAYLLLWGLG